MISPDLDSFFSEEKRELPDNVRPVQCRSALSRSRLPGLEFALNPYIGCEHACAYCYAPYVMNRDPRAWGGPIEAKMNIPALLAKEVDRVRGTVGVGTVTDPYQPAERQLELTHKCLVILSRKKIPISIHTKSDLILRDMELIRGGREAEVGITVTTVNEGVAQQWEPRSPSPFRRLKAVESLVKEGVDTYVLVGPIVPLVTDKDVGTFADAIAMTGVRRVMLDKLRLRPGMLERLGQMDLFGCEDWSRFQKAARSSEYAMQATLELEAAFKARSIKVEHAF
jgi:DNA repair photolyase